MQRRTGHLRRVNDARFQHVHKFARSSVVAHVEVFFLHALGDHRAVLTGIFGNPLQGRGQRPGHDLRPDQLFAAESAIRPGFQAGSQVRQGGATAGDDALFGCRLGGVDRIFEAQLAILHFGFGGGTDFDHGHTTGQFGQALLELFLIVGRLGFVHLATDLLAAGLHVGFVAFGDDRGVVLGEGDPAGLTQHVQLGAFQLQTGVFGDHLTAGEHGDVFEHGLAAIAKARSLDRSHVQHTAQPVHHQGGEGFFFDVFSDDQQGLASAGGLLQHGHQVLNQGDFLVGEQDVGAVEDGFHPLGVGGEVGGDVAFVEAHPFGDFQFGGHRFAFFEGDDALFAHLLHGVGDHVAHFFVVAGGDGGHLGDRLKVALGHGAGLLGNLLHQVADRLVDPALQGDGVGPSGHIAQPFFNHRVGQHGGGGGAVAGSVVGLGGGLADQGHAGVLDVIFEFNFLGDRHPIVDDLGSAKFLFQHHVAAFGAEGDGHGFRQDVHAFFEGTTSVFVVDNLLSHRSSGT